MIYKKLNADCNEELWDQVMKAVRLERRTLANFIRLSCEEKAKKILEADSQ